MPRSLESWLSHEAKATSRVRQTRFGSVPERVGVSADNFGIFRVARRVAATACVYWDRTDCLQHAHHLRTDPSRSADRLRRHVLSCTQPLRRCDSRVFSCRRGLDGTVLRELPSRDHDDVDHGQGVRRQESSFRWKAFPHSAFDLRHSRRIAVDVEKASYYRQALALYQDAAVLFPDDAQTFLYQGLCHERLTALAFSPDEKQREFALGESALRAAIERRASSGDYNPAMPYRALASLYSHVNDYPSALDSLRKAREVDPDRSDLAQLDHDIESVELYLANQGKKR